MGFLHYHTSVLLHATNTIVINLSFIILFFYIELQSLHSTVVNRTIQMERKLNSLNLQLEDFKKIKELRISSSHDSEVMKHHKDVGVQFNYIVPVSG